MQALPPETQGPACKPFKDAVVVVGINEYYHTNSNEGTIKF